jgi:hypothetical protein
VGCVALKKRLRSDQYLNIAIVTCSCRLFPVILMYSIEIDCMVVSDFDITTSRSSFRPAVATLYIGSLARRSILASFSVPSYLSYSLKCKAVYNAKLRYSRFGGVKN